MTECFGVSLNLTLETEYMYIIFKTHLNLSRD